MKYCAHCGNEVLDEAIVCPKCGCSVDYEIKRKPAQASTADDKLTLRLIAKVFMIIGTVVMGIGLFLIPLAWCLPMTIAYSNKIKNNEPVSIGFKVCVLIFVNVIAGVLMLCDND